MERTDVGESRGGRRSLRQVWLRVQHSRFAHAMGICRWQCLPDLLRSCGGANSSQQVGDFFGITHSTKESLHSCARKGGEEVVQVHANHNLLANVWSNE